MTSEAYAGHARILVALESREREQQTLQLGAEVAALWHSELVAVCVEARELVQLSALPFASEIDRLSAVRRDLDEQRLLNAFRIWRRQVDNQLARLASAHRIAASSAVIQGRVWQEMLSFAGAGDLLLVGASLSVPLARARLRRPIALLQFGTIADTGALAVARALARRFQTHVIAWSINADRDTATAGEDANVVIESRTLDDPEQLVEALNRAQCRWVVASRQTLAEAGIDLQEFLRDPNRTAFLAP